MFKYYHANQVHGLSTEEYRFVEARLKLAEARLRDIPEFQHFDDIDVHISAEACHPGMPVAGTNISRERLLIVAALEGQSLLGHPPLSRDLIFVQVDPNQPSYKSTDDLSLERTLFHEAHHVERIRNVGFKGTLGEAIVLEGLATNFEKQSLGKAGLYSSEVDYDTLVGLQEELKGQVNKDDYNHNEIFLNGSEHYPRHFGYSLGHVIVSHWLHQNNLKASQGLKADTGDILRPWLAGEILASDQTPVLEPKRIVKPNLSHSQPV